ncbi:MAG: hypothetical protein TECD_00934 [Hyphomicrobiaceae bacterium hypho_1]
MKKAYPFYPGTYPIDSYGNGGFRFAKTSHRGSIICCPSGIYTWNIQDFFLLKLNDLEIIREKLVSSSLLILGTGKTHISLSSETRIELFEAGINFDTMSTGAACRTYNILLAEGRPIMAGLLAVD